jgi:hypothetical protein
VVRQFVYRWTAFSFFVCAAFAWVPPFIDRAGMAALGFGVLALSLGRAWGVARPGITAPAPTPAMFDLESLMPAHSDAVERIGAYSDDDGR